MASAIGSVTVLLGAGFLLSLPYTPYSLEKAVVTVTTLI